MEYVQDKLANLMIKEADHIKKITNLEGMEREVYDKSEKIRFLEEELIEVQMEAEVIKKRLESSDSVYRKFMQVYD